jgi:exonuclease VII small subunit
MIDQKTINELEMSIDFGKRLMEYKKECLHKMLEQMDENDKIRQHYEADRLYIQDIVRALENGENMQTLYAVKSRLTVVGQMFFKKEFKALKELLNV